MSKSKKRSDVALLALWIALTTALLLYQNCSQIREPIPLRAPQSESESVLKNKCRQFVHANATGASNHWSNEESALPADCF